MIKIDQKEFWLDGDGNACTREYLKEEIKTYTKNGGKIYVGSDSMLRPEKCSFAAVIALHDNSKKIARYYYKKINDKSESYLDLKIKILEEVNLSIQVAQYILEICPDADIELHVDIGTKKANLTSKLHSMISGWVTGMGFEIKVKPNSWASSSIADWHTK
jgi:uncharacterized protein